MRNYLLYALPLISLMIHTNNHSCGQKWLYESSQEKECEQQQAQARRAALLITANYYQYEFPHASGNTGRTVNNQPMELTIIRMAKK